MKRWLKMSIGIAAGLITILLLALLLLTSFNWNRAKPWIEQPVREATQRNFSIRGDLSLSWERPPQERTWRRWVPWPHLRAKDVMLGNTDWASTGSEMARIVQMDFNINPLLLFKKTISVQSLLLTEPLLNLEQDKKGGNNWTFPKKKSESEWQITLEDLSMVQGTIRYVDEVKHADMRVRVDALPNNSVRWTVTGKFNDEPITGNANTGTLLSLQESGIPSSVDAKIIVGETTITVNGTVTDPAHPSALDAKLKIIGASMADLFPLSGVLLPETPKFSTEGRIVGTLGRGKLRLRYENFKGQVGVSDISGTFEYIQKAPRPLLQGDIVSTHLNVNDLIAIVGAGEGKKKQKADEMKQPPEKILPVAPFKTERWGKMDADVRFNGKKIIHSEKLPFENLHTHVKMVRGVLSLAPLNFGVADGNLTMELNIDGISSPAKARMKISARGMKLKALFPSIEEMRASLGEVHGNAQLSGTGNSFAALAASSNGEILALISEGTVSEFVMEKIGLNVGRMVVSKLFGDRQVRLNCMAANLGVDNGVMQSHIFLVDTQDALIRMEGNINLARETLSLVMRPQNKGVRLFSLRSPIYITGTFKNPDVGLDKGVLGLKAGAALALGAVASPVAALLALTQPGSGESNYCGTLLAEVQRKPVAPPPEIKSKTLQRSVPDK